MADDDVAPPPEPPRRVTPSPSADTPADPAVDLAGAERPAETFAETAAAEPAAAETAAFGSPFGGSAAAERAAVGGTSATRAWDTGAADRATAAADTPRQAERSALPTVLAVLGVVIVLLLGATLYTLYNPPANGALDTAVADVTALKRSVAALEARPQQTVDLGPLDRRLTALAADVASLKGDLGATAQKADAAAGLAPGLAAVQASVANLPKIDLAPLQTGIVDLGTRVGAVDKTVAALDGRVGANDGRIAAIDGRLKPLEAYFNAPKATEQVTEVRQNGSAAETRAAPLAVLAQGVLAALAQGRPFGAEAEALGRLGVDPATLAPLKAVADKGAMTQAALVAGFEAVQDRLVVAAAPVETGTVLDRMMASAESVVSVKRTGAAKGDDAGAVASRVDADLKRGEFAAALTQWQALPADSQAASADWAAGLKARVAAEDAARSIQEKAVAALAAAP